MIWYISIRPPLALKTDSQLFSKLRKVEFKIFLENFRFLSRVLLSKHQLFLEMDCLQTTLDDLIKNNHKGHPSVDATYPYLIN